MPEQTEAVTEAEILGGLAPLAKQGVRAFFLIGKLKGAPVRRVSEKTQEVTVKADVICGEGETITLKFGAGDTLPGAGFQGAFLIDPPREYLNKTSANCLGFL